MEVITNNAVLPPQFRGAVCALGNFDGVHCGHRVVIEQTIETARRAGKLAAVIAFEPHPRQYFRPDDPPFRLASQKMKVRLLSELNVDAMFVLTFDDELAAHSADRFVNDILLKKLGVGHLVVGYDFRFGKGRSGDLEFLQKWGAENNIGLSVIDPVRMHSGDHPTFSSTRVRDFLVNGDVKRAAEILGHNWMIDGVVQHGDKRGRTIGFPTANVSLKNYLRPALGVYAVRIEVPEGASKGNYTGVANFGRRPTFDKNDELLEVHLFDFEGDLYDQNIFISFCDFIRPERKFDGLDSLKAQIKKDCETGRQFFESELEQKSDQ